MTLSHILVLSGFSLAVAWILPARWRAWALLIGSLTSVYWFQTSSPIRFLDFWLPTLATGLALFVWSICHTNSHSYHRLSLMALLLLFGVVLVISLTRYSNVLCCLTPSRPPPFSSAIIGCTIILLLAALPTIWPKARLWSGFAIVLILVAFVILKTPSLAQALSGWLRQLTGQSIELANAADIPWLGFSYLAFRLIHILRDFQTGKLQDYPLHETLIYALFYPTYTAGPIDRLPRFSKDLQQLQQDSPVVRCSMNATNLLAGGQRILVGMFKKFVLADSLALLALNAQTAVQVTSTPWIWVLLYAYALRLYLDFSGYTDIAIGIGRLMGFNLPENFNRPYLTCNLTAFWNAWHMTLAQWFRAYYFNPLTRSIRSRIPQLPVWSVILIGQLTTMALIGLWHGVSWNFIIWGSWHGLGLFIHNRWSEWIKPRWARVKLPAWAISTLSVVAWAITFHYVVIGWVWFALPEPSTAWHVFLRLFRV